MAGEEANRELARRAVVRLHAKYESKMRELHVRPCYDSRGRMAWTRAKLFLRGYRRARKNAPWEGWHGMLPGFEGVVDWVWAPTDPSETVGELWVKRRTW